MSRSRAWCFTIHNYTEENYEHIKSVECRYLIIAKEKGESEKTDHLQGYIEFDTQRTMGGIKKLFKNNTVHLEVRRGTAQQAREYCTKENEFFEKGEISNQGQRRDLDTVKNDM